MREQRGIARGDNFGRQHVRRGLRGLGACERRVELDQQITALEAHPGADPLEIVELKKRKLAVKEELATIERA